MARELFIYWKVARELAPSARAAADALLQALARTQPALQARLMQRAEEVGAQVTFMETYRAPDGGVTLALQAAIQAEAQVAFAPFAALGVPARHVEAFVSLSG